MTINDASAAFVDQITALNRAEAIVLWRQHGLTQQQADWLRANPRMIDHLMAQSEMTSR